jgi:hypothetical protein
MVMQFGVDVVILFHMDGALLVSHLMFYRLGGGALPNVLYLYMYVCRCFKCVSKLCRMLDFLFCCCF